MREEASPVGTATVEQTITPAERWLLISEKAYHRAQSQGFVGGDPFDYWLEAEKEVDAKYHSDSRNIFSQADARQLSEHVNSVFGGFSFGHLGLDAILEKHRKGLEILAEQDQKLIQTTAELAARQTAVLQSAVSEAVDMMHSLSQGKFNTQTVARQAELSMQAVENVLSHLRALTEMATGSAKPKDSGKTDK